MNVFSAIFFIVLFFSLSFGAGERCGTMRFIEEFRNPQKRTFIQKYSAESLAGIRERKTEHFIIYYVTEGSHAVRTLDYIEALAKYLEQAYDLHKNTLGMKNISGAVRTIFYDKVVPSGLYPVEVMDPGVWNKEYCGSYGLTFPPNERRPRESQIAIENDFVYGVNCPEVEKNKGDPFSTRIHKDYSKEWHLALKVTVFHELYHSFQLAQFDISNYHTFWLEASATGVEEIGAPEVNDYIDYLRNVFSNLGKSMENLKRGEEYGYATLYLFLSSKLGLKFDSYIWDFFSRSPEETFAVQLARYVISQGKDVEDLFHEYAERIFYSGLRASAPLANPFSDDMPIWPTWEMKTSTPLYLPAGTFDFIKTLNRPNTDSVTGISELPYGKNNDSTVWVLSRLLTKDFVPPPFAPQLKEFVAFPNPWNPKRFEKVNFGPLPKNSKGVEIRSSNGILLKRIDGKAGNILPWQPEKLPVPGILYYRPLPYGKNKVLIVEY